MSVWTFCIPGALVPKEISIHAANLLPKRLAHALKHVSKADESLKVENTTTHLDWLWQQFGGSGTAVSAPYLWALLGADAHTPKPSTLWLCQPAHFAMARDHVLVQPIDPHGIDHMSLITLMSIADNVAQAFGARIIQHQNRSFFHTQAPWQMETTPFDYALGRSLTECWPTGSDAGRWRKLLTEIQIAWHHHPINVIRRDNDEPEINGLWIEGSGALEEKSLGTPYQMVICDDLRIHSWAHAAGIPTRPMHACTDETPAHTNILFVLPELLSAANASDWGVWMQCWKPLVHQLESLSMQARALGHDVTLELFGQNHVRMITLSRRDRWCFWRMQPNAYLATLLTEPHSDIDYLAS